MFRRSLFKKMLNKRIITSSIRNKKFSENNQQELSEFKKPLDNEIKTKKGFLITDDRVIFRSNLLKYMLLTINKKFKFLQGALSGLTILMGFNYFYTISLGIFALQALLFDCNLSY